MARSKKTDTAKTTAAAATAEAKTTKTASAAPKATQLAVWRHGMDNRCSDRTCSCGMGRRARTEKDCRKGY